MKYKLTTLYIALFWFALFVGGLWVLKILIQASRDPYFASGLFGGVIWCLVMRGIWDALSGSLDEAVQEFKKVSK